MSVVVAYSPSEQGRAALRAGAAQARSRRAPLVVASHSFIDSGKGRTTADEDELRAELAALDEAPADVRLRASADPDVGAFLLQVIEAEEAELLVIGLRGKSRIGKLHLGATARRVVLASPCPVLAVKEDHAAA
ncbi:universal stress protein [Brachybacterium nesterenkovii]|uniref:UspA domain protein n=1 Tax=Brachybacterium nesterenkovii TaxID=47847 RepID=A0A1X6WXF4_9MICO|nr:universal stress protein [Brachybacterium nesterenkovii]SLM89418.1 UspA domain protein [Brachybacterium nesterenkovii]